MCTVGDRVFGQTGQRVNWPNRPKSPLPSFHSSPGQEVQLAWAKEGNHLGTVGDRVLGDAEAIECCMPCGSIRVSCHLHEIPPRPRVAQRTEGRCPMIVENRQLVTNEPVEVQECRKITDHSRGIYRICPKLVKEQEDVNM